MENTGRVESVTGPGCDGNQTGPVFVTWQLFCPVTRSIVLLSIQIGASLPPQIIVNSPSFGIIVMQRVDHSHFYSQWKLLMSLIIEKNCLLLLSSVPKFHFNAILKLPDYFNETH